MSTSVDGRPDMYLSSPAFVAINPFRLSFSRVHSRLWHTHSSANGLQSVPKDWICIISLFRGNSDSQAPFDSPQNAARFKQESSNGFLSNVLATFLFRGDNLWRVFGWFSQLSLLQLMEIRAWQLPGDKLETYCHSSLIQFFCTVSDYCRSRQFRVRSKANKSPPNVTGFLCSDSRVALLHPAVSVKSAGWIPSLRLNKPNWSSKPISVHRWLGQRLGLFRAQKKRLEIHMSNWIFPPITCVANQQWWCPRTLSTQAALSLHNNAKPSPLWLRGSSVHWGFAVTAH